MEFHCNGESGNWWEGFCLGEVRWGCFGGGAAGKKGGVGDV